MFLQPIILLIIVIGTLKFFFGKVQQDIQSHWSTLFGNFKYSPSSFYTLLENRLEEKNINGLIVSTTTLKEKSIFSSNRLYLKVVKDNLEYYICCAPFSDTTFFSNWLILNKSRGEIIISQIPFIGSYLAKKLFPKTFYTHDTTEIIMGFIHESMLSVIDEITKEKGLKKLSNAERKPVLRDLFKR